MSERRCELTVSVWADPEVASLDTLTDRIELYVDDWLAARGGERVDMCLFERERRPSDPALSAEVVADALRRAGFREHEGRWLAPSDPAAATPLSTVAALVEMADDAASEHARDAA